jgi:multiple sugar transport system ATP-binding protein
VVSAGGVELPWTGAPNGEVVLGLRPERLTMSADDGRPAIMLSVDVVEPLGSEVMVHGTVGSAAVTARLPGDATTAPGERLRLSFDPARASLFDAASGAAL